MKNYLALALSTFLVGSIASAEPIELSIDDLWDKSIEKILDADGLPTFRDKELGIIKTDLSQ